MIKKPEEFVVSPFTVIIDTREQAPWQFRGLKADAKDGNVPLLVKTETEALKTGDYSIEGLEQLVCIERKSHQDLIGSISSGRKRFEAEFHRMSQMRHAAVIVEAGLLDVIYKPPRHSRMNPKAVIRTALSWSIRYGVHWWFAPSRSYAETLCYRLLEQFWRIHQEENGNANNVRTS